MIYFNYCVLLKTNIIIKLIIIYFRLGMGIGDWGWGIGDWAQSPIPNPQSPIPNPQSPFVLFLHQIIIENEI